MTLNYIWIAFFLLAFVFALFKLIFFGDTEIFSQIVASTFDMSKTAFDISIGLTGTLALWMGLMKVGEEAGMVKILAKVVDPFFRRIFPEIPHNHPAMGPIMMNFSANMLGLDNAATPLGLKAMEEMQKLNPEKETATNAQIMFLVLNTSGLTLIPITVLMYRAQMGAAQPSDVFIPILLATLCSTIGGLVVVSLFQKIKLFDKVILAYLGGLLALIAFTIWGFQQLTPEETSLVSSLVSNVVLFSIIVSFVGLALIKKVNAYEVFVEGAKEGFKVAVNIIPFLVAMLVAIGVFRASGALDMISSGIAFVFTSFGVNADFVDALPTAFMKPLSGSGARGMMIEAMQNFGADSFVGKLVSTLQGSTDTTLYIVAVYFGSVKIRNTRYAITSGLAADFIGIIAAILICYLFFG